MSPPAASIPDDAQLLEELRACQALGVEEALELSPAGADEIDAMRQSVATQVAKERGLAGALRSLPTWLRVTLVALGAVVTTGLAALLTPRIDLSRYPIANMAATLGVLGLLLIAAGAHLLRPLHRPPPSARAGAALLLGSILIPMALLAVPLAHDSAPSGEGARFVLACVKCLGFGGGFALPVVLLALLLRRAHVGGPGVAGLAGVAAGLAGNLALQVHCPISDPAHIVTGHVPLVGLIAALTAGWYSYASRGRSPAQP